ncbi:hypothetical protein HHK36_016571 [Tetracentron sinense]|uniref:Uncharacterized protein n=1 Tax=Tetracentron sinense TaxID=13715 RepID=A0A835DC22_TETSI|nr:hypothetical protein HHK36_016571 [Tetracentron sinense]
MELRSSITAGFVLFLLLLLAWPNISLGGPDAADLNSDIYEIDYRGPETHSYVPPPNRSGRKPPLHSESVVARPKSKVAGANNVGRKGKTIHG